MNLAFIDSDPLLDVILSRAAFYNSLAQILSLSANSDYNFCTSVHTLLNVHYFTKKYLGAEAAKKAVTLLTQQVQIIIEDVNLIALAIASDFLGVVDTVQFYAASAPALMQSSPEI